jgi:hypothetical protein
MKCCKYCNIEKDTTEFYTSSRHTDGFLHKCKECSNKYIRERYRKNPEIYKLTNQRHHNKYPNAKKKNSIKSIYNISLDEYQDILVKQNNSCAICLTHRDSFKKELDIDHCHIKNIVRGILCPSCNKALGLFKDSEDILKSALQYLINSNKCI